MQAWMLRARKEGVAPKQAGKTPRRIEKEVASEMNIIAYPVYHSASYLLIWDISIIFLDYISSKELNGGILQ